MKINGPASKRFSHQFKDLVYIPRWSIIRNVRQQSVAEHSYFVTLYGLAIAKYVGYTGSMSILVRELMTHDLDEMITGDINSPVKWDVERKMKTMGRGDHRIRVQNILVGKVDHPPGMQYTNLPVHDVSPSTMEEDCFDSIAIRKVADVYEACLYLAEEKSMGNMSVDSGDNSLLRHLKDSLNLMIAELMKKVENGEEHHLSFEDALHIQISMAASGNYCTITAGDFLDA